MMMLANVHSIETFGAFDGPGIRYVIFLQGCPFQCQYCHNRDTWSTDKNHLMSADNLLDEYHTYRSFYKKGGITVSGGEPLLQLEFLIELFSKAKEKGIHTCLDTSAACYHEKNIKRYEELLKVTDLVLLDLKHMDEDEHLKLTGSTLNQVHKFATLLNEKKVPTVIRHVLVPSITDDETHLKKMKSFIDTLSNVVDVEVLSYHKKGIQKWEAMGLTYPLKHIEEPTQEAVLKAKSILTHK